MMEKTLSPLFISNNEFNLHQTYSLLGQTCNVGWVRIPPDLTSHFGVACPWVVKKNDVSSFSQAPLIRYLSNLQVTRTCIKARMSSNLGRIRLFTLDLFALER